MPFITGGNHGSIRIYYEESGAGAPVVLIGGLTSTVEIWEWQTAALAERYRVIRPDNRGSGRTEVSPDDGVRAMERFAGDIVLLLDGVGLEHVHLIGASMGGMIVQEFALHYPERLLSLVIACSHPGGAQVVQAEQQVLDKMLGGSRADASPEARRGALEAVFHPSSFAKHPEAVSFYAATKERFPHPAEEVARRAQAIAGWTSWDRLPELRVPTLVVTGSQDLLVPIENSRRLAARIPGAELVLIDGGAHVFFLEQPAQTNRTLLDFLARHGRQRQDG